MYNINIQEKTELNKLIYKHASIFYRFCANFFGERNIEVKDIIYDILENIADGDAGYGDVEYIIGLLKSYGIVDYDDDAIKSLKLYATDEITKDDIIKSLERSFEDKTLEEIRYFFRELWSKKGNLEEQTPLFYIINFLKSKYSSLNLEFKEKVDKIIDILIENKLKKTEILYLFYNKNPKVENLSEQEQPYHSKDTVSLLDGHVTNKFNDMINYFVSDYEDLINHLNDAKKTLSTHQRFRKFDIGGRFFSCGMVGMSLVVLTAAYSITYFKLLNIDVQNMANMAVEIAFKVFVASLVAMSIIFEVSNIEKNNRISKTYDILFSVENKEDTKYNKFNGHELEKEESFIDEELGELGKGENSDDDSWEGKSSVDNNELENKDPDTPNALIKEADKVCVNSFKSALSSTPELKCCIRNEKQELIRFDKEKFKEEVDKIIDILIKKGLKKREILYIFFKMNPKAEGLSEEEQPCHSEEEQPCHSKDTFISLLDGYISKKLNDLINDCVFDYVDLINHLNDAKDTLSTSSNFRKFIIGVEFFSYGMVGMSLVVLTAAYSITYFKLLNLDVQNMANIAVEIAFKVFVASLVAMAFILTVSNIEKNNRISKSYDILPSVEDKENTQHNESNGYESEEKGSVTYGNESDEEKRSVVDNEDSEAYGILPFVEDKKNTQHNESNGYKSEEKRNSVTDGNESDEEKRSGVYGEYCDSKPLSPSSSLSSLSSLSSFRSAKSKL